MPMWSHRHQQRNVTSVKATNSGLRLPDAKLMTSTAIGASRALTQSNIKLHQPWYRGLVGCLGNLAIRLLTTWNLVAQCKFKLSSNRIAELLFFQQLMTRVASDAEVLFLTQRLKLRIVEVPVTWTNSQRLNAI